MLHSWDGVLPVRELLKSCRPLSWTKLLYDEGMLPLRRLVEAYRKEKLESCPKYVGSVPVNTFQGSFSDTRLKRLPNALGIVPFMLLPLTSNNVNVERPPRDAGIVPDGSPILAIRIFTTTPPAHVTPLQFDPVDVHTVVVAGVLPVQIHEVYSAFWYSNVAADKSHIMDSVCDDSVGNGDINGI